MFWLLTSHFLQLGVSGVDELRQVLGTTEESRRKTKSESSTLLVSSAEKSSDKNNETSDELVYRDSSTFLKVHYISF